MFLRLIALASLPVISGCGGTSDQTNQTSASSPQTAPTHSSPTPAPPPISEQQIQTALDSASAHIQRRDLPSAQTILESLITKAPQDVRGYELLGEVLYSLSLDAHQRGDATASKDYRARAADVYRSAVNVDPKSAELRYSAGMIMLMAGAEDDALNMLETAGELDATNQKYPLYAAQILIKQKRYDEAESALERVLLIDSQEGVAYASLAVIAMERGDFFTAQENIERARAIDPDNFDFRAQEARIIRRGGNPQRALEMLTALPVELQAWPTFGREIAAAYADLGQPAKAAQSWQRVYQAQHGAAEAWYAAAQAAELLIQAGNRDEALIWIRQAELLAPQEQQVMSLRKKLAEAANASD